MSVDILFLQLLEFDPDVLHSIFFYEKMGVIQIIDNKWLSISLRHLAIQMQYKLLGWYVASYQDPTSDSWRAHF